MKNDPMNDPIVRSAGVVYGVVIAICVLLLVAVFWLGWPPQSPASLESTQAIGWVYRVQEPIECDRWHIYDADIGGAWPLVPQGFNTHE